jgi:hypothetical protein
MPKAAFGALVVTAKPTEIVARNLEAAAVLYSASALEEMQLFTVADRVAAHFSSGKLPVGGAKNAAATFLAGRSDRLSAQERQRLYGHVLGAGSTANPNTEFSPLLARFLASVSKFERQRALVKNTKKTVSAAKVHAAARDLAQNLSNHSYGAVAIAAAMLARHIRDVDALLSHPDVLAAYACNNVWQLVGKVAKDQLGKKVNTVRARTRAEAGGAILAWLGKVTAPLAASGGAPELAASLTASRVPEKVRDLSRVVSPKQEILSAQTVKVQALCFDKKRRLVPCKVQLK